jgi:hypothetical protein
VKGKKSFSILRQGTTMKLTMRVHSLSLPIGTRSPQAQLYRVDDIKRRRESGWTDRITLHGTDLQLGDIVIVTVEKEADHQASTDATAEAVAHPRHDEGATEDDTKEGSQ